jgi:P-type Ca2+ transporter type 2C
MQLPWGGRDGPGNDTLLPTSNIPSITGHAGDGIDSKDGDRPQRPSRHVRTTSSDARVSLNMRIYSKVFDLHRLN